MMVLETVGLFNGRARQNPALERIQIGTAGFLIECRDAALAGFAFLIAEFAVDAHESSPG
jgi:hypothetical protein